MTTGRDGAAGPSGGSAETTANAATRHFLLGLPRDGPAPGSREAASLQAAEAFVGEIQREILAYDMANARAAEAFARRWWEKTPFFGKRWAAAADADEAQRAIAGEAKRRGQFHVERTAASGDGAINEEGRGKGYGSNKQKKPQAQMNTWLFKQRSPGWVPLIQRWWVPYLCVAGVCVLWTPDSWKLRTLCWGDHKYAIFRQEVHKAYWRATMSAEDYEELMRDLELDRPRSVKASDCPL